MKILIIHNSYQQYGGEDAVTRSVCDLLNQNREQLYFYERSNLEINDLPLHKKAMHLFSMHWSKQSYKEIKQVIREFYRPDVVHVFNTFFTITPSIYYACKEEGIPVVQSLYNYRMVCANALFLRQGKHCTDCLTKSRWRSVLYPCYRDSRILTSLMVRMINKHWQMKTWINLVDRYITVTEFSRQIFIKMGIPAEKILSQPQFLPWQPKTERKVEDYVLYIGRISFEKGIETLLKAWESIPELPLKIMGEGPLLNNIKKIVKEKKLTNVEVLGHLPYEQYLTTLKGAKFLVVPSISYDNFPRTIVEAYSFGVPVVASNVEGIKEFVKENVSGYLFKVGDHQDLAQKIRWAAGHEDELKVMSLGARAEFENYYTSRSYYPFLKSVYNEVVENYQKQPLAYAAH